jgi:hypothetical protein
LRFSREWRVVASNRSLSGSAFQNTLKTSLCACRLFPTARQFWKALPDSDLDRAAVMLRIRLEGRGTSLGVLSQRDGRIVQAAIGQVLPGP